MTSAGMSEAIANTYVEMGNAITRGILFEDFDQHKPDVWGSTKLVDFVKEFATICKSQG
jgi:hypothetical protein